MKKFISTIFTCALFSLSMFSTASLAQVVGGIGVSQFAFQGEKASTEASFDADTVMAELQTKLNKALVESRKFRVYDHDQLQARLNEENADLAGYVSGQYKDEKYALAGLDYLLVGEVSEYGIFEPENGEGGKIGVVEIDFELIGTTYGTIARRFDATARGQVDTDGNENNSLDSAVTDAVDEVVAAIMFNLFPLRVMTVDDAGVVKLNYGQGVLKSGDTVRIFAPIKPTGNGAVEAGPAGGNPVATVQVTSVDTKFASAQILDGAEQIQRGLKAEIL